jgi:mannosidase alpha-like ER degradation enhancer 2
MVTTSIIWPICNSLAAFWPALEVLAGNIADAMETHESYYGVWRRFGFTPEGFNLAGAKP